MIARVLRGLNLLPDYNNLLLDYNNLLPDYNKSIIIYYYYNPRININPSCLVIRNTTEPKIRSKGSGSNKIRDVNPVHQSNVI